MEIRCLLREDDSDGDKILELAKNKNKNCKKYEGSDVCLLKFENKPDGINACHVEITKMKEKHARYSIYIRTVTFSYVVVHQACCKRGGRGAYALPTE